MASELNLFLSLHTADLREVEYRGYERIAVPLSEFKAGDGGYINTRRIYFPTTKTVRTASDAPILAHMGIGTSKTGEQLVIKPLAVAVQVAGGMTPAIPANGLGVEDEYIGIMSTEKRKVK